MNDPIRAKDAASGCPEWTTCSGQVVGIGDTVALSLLKHPDAIGVIQAAADDGEVYCVLTQCKSCPAGQLLTVHEDQLLVLIEKRSGSKR